MTGGYDPTVPGYGLHIDDCGEVHTEAPPILAAFMRALEAVLDARKDAADAMAGSAIGRTPITVDQQAALNAQWDAEEAFARAGRALTAWRASLRREVVDR